MKKTILILISVATILFFIGTGCSKKSKIRKGTCFIKASNFNVPVGRSFLLRCPNNCTSFGSIWGTDIYTTDSSICGAAVHSGVLAPGRAGVVRVRIRPGQPSYAGSDRNGLRSSSWGSYRTSFTVERRRR